MNAKAARGAWVCVLVLAGAAASARVARAQCPVKDTLGQPAGSRLRFVGSAADDSARIGSLVGACWGRASLIRSSVAFADSTRGGGLTIVPLDAVGTGVWNSRIPVSRNDGAAWAGRGWTTSLMLGASAAFRDFQVVAAPQIVSSANGAFPIVPSGNASRSSFASPFHSGKYSADLPLRFGDQRYTRIDPGESTIELVKPAFAAGVTSATQWWGPGVRNALVMSNNAAGIPQVFIRTARPLATPLGAIEAHWLLGMLTESPFFDRDPRNDQRSMSAAVATLRVAADSGLTIGAARSVYRVIGNIGGLAPRFADVLVDWGRPGPERPSDQIYSMFARWSVPASGIAAHVEWAHLQLPSSIREALVDPQQTQGFTLGLEWARALDSRTLLRAQGEVTMLEQTPLVPAADGVSYYTSRAVPQGYTQQGQVIGASTGPGSSSQYFGIDLFRGSWQIGGNVGRIRYEDEAFYRSFPAGLTHYNHDVAIFAGLEGRLDTRHLSVDAALTRTHRLSFLFRTFDAYNPSIRAFDVRNTTLALRLTPRR